MSAIERALEKQRLLLESTLQRDALVRYGSGLQPLIETAERMQHGARWVRRHPEWLAVGVTAVAAARPGVRRWLWQWGKRSFIAWRLWRDSVHWLDQSPSARRPMP